MIVLTDWKKGNFIETASGCLFPDTRCWQTVVSNEKLKFNSKYQGHSHGAIARSISESSQSSLTSPTSLLIDPTWNNPHLVFWYDNQIDGSVNVFAKLDGETQPSIWETLMSRVYTSENLSSLRWNVEALDLNRYKGHKIWISINAEIIVAPSQNLHLPFTTDKLHLQKILILPDYQPGMEDELGSVAAGTASETSPVISSTQNLTGTSPSEPFQLSDWRLGSLAVKSAGCKFPDLICWESMIQREEAASNPSSVMNGANKRTTPQENHSNLVTRSSLFIDPAWSNPQLVFWFDNPFPGDLFVSVKSDIKWVTIAHIPLTGQNPGNWQTTSIDLSQLKGKTVLISISVTLKIPMNTLQDNTSTGLVRWHIQNIQIIPNFTPTP
jgi:hypothetical protein